MEVAIVKYNAGNIQSVMFALERIGVNASVTEDADEIASAAKVIFPGVGEAATAMKFLKERNLDQLIKNLTQPVLGICLGMQLMCDYSEEGDTGCLGIFPLKVKKFHTVESDLKVPQIGWNNIYGFSSELFDGVDNNSYVYNVHSYYVEHSAFTIATTKYSIEYASAIKKNNFLGVQFHAEKSGDAGDRILKNFIEIKSK
jgi:glutamine amidotransferase